MTLLFIRYGKYMKIIASY